jgi:ribosomal protein S18 acetylase RimI-like enzyme
VEDILALDMLTLQAHTRAAGDVFDEASHRTALAEVLPKSEVIKIHRGETLAGYTYLWPKGGGLWFVGGFAVHPGFRTGAVLRALLAKFRVLAAEKNIAELQSHVYKTNPRSLALHRRLGFAEIDENEKGFAFSLKIGVG